METSLFTSPHSWSPDGKTLAIQQLTPDNGFDIATLDFGDAFSTSTAAGSSEPAEPKLFASSPFGDMSPSFSPDGRWIAYQSTRTGQRAIFVQPFPGPGGRWQISTPQGREPRWSPKGDEIFYLSDDRMMAVPYTAEGDVFRPGEPRELFQGDIFSAELGGTYDVFPDGEHFVMLQSVGGDEEPPGAELVLVTNWFDELERLVPAN